MATEKKTAKRSVDAGITPEPWEIGKPWTDSNGNRCIDILYNKPPCELCKKPVRDEYIVARTFGNALPKNQQMPNVRLIAAAPALYSTLRRIAEKGCQVIWGNHEEGFTCLDKQEHANNNPDRYTPEFRAEVLSAGFPCVECQSRAALALVDKHDNESARRPISDRTAHGQAS